MSALHFVYFDVETERLSSEVGGWKNIEQLGLSVAVTLSSKDGEFRVYRAHEADSLVEELRACDCVVGFNVRGFDFRVLQPYADVPLRELPNLDLLLDLKDRAGFRPSLENVCATTLQTGKSSSGTQAVEWWRTGRHQEVIEYCKQDVLLTRRLHEWGASHGTVKLLDKKGRLQTVPVPWSLDALPAPPPPPAPSQQPSLFD